MFKCCKYCKSLNLTIVEPSSTQYCTLRYEYVKKDNICKDYRFDETRISFWEYVEKELKKKEDD